MQVRPGTPCSEGDEHTVRKRRMILEEQLRGLQPEMCLDAGCGMGVYLPLYLPFGSIVIGVDISHANLRRARQYAGNDRAWLALMTLDALGFPDGMFDFIACIETLEHVQNDHAVLSEFRRLTKPGGRLLLTVPYKGFPFETHGIRLGSRELSSPLGLGFPLLSLLPARARESFATVRLYSVRGLSNLLMKEGFLPESVTFLMPGLDAFERRAGSGVVTRLIRRFFEWLGRKLAGVWGSTLVIIAEAVERDVGASEGMRSVE